ncbi:MAG: exodeoxyribonuclease VII small subunit [Gammaproteobacteria bacterium]
MAGKKPGNKFEQDLQELEQLVEKMEQGELSLEESLKHFERGIELTRNCQKELSKAEQKVKKLQDDNEQELVDFPDAAGQGQDDD